jgi:prephenate dehydrogenase
MIVDFGSTKELIANRVKSHPNRSQYISAHPIAGTEYSGPSAAFPSLYTDKVMIVCDTEESDQVKLKQFEWLCMQIGMKLRYMSSREHDIHLAYVSHLSHIISFSLSNTVLDKEKEHVQILNLAGSGFDSTVRLAKSSPDMWAPIFLKNRNNLLDSLEDYLKYLEKFRTALVQEDQEEIKKLLTKGREIRKILK